MSLGQSRIEQNLATRTMVELKTAVARTVAPIPAVSRKKKHLKPD